MTTFKFMGRDIPCQDIKATKLSFKRYSPYLSALCQTWAAVERYTGHLWRATSYIRVSPNHQTTFALDIAPDIDPQCKDQYAVFRNSDPVLYKREPLIRQLQALCHEVEPDRWSVGIFIEPDHLHLQLFQVETVRPTITVHKWKVPKPCYPDTYERMELPVTSSAYNC